MDTGKTIDAAQLAATYRRHPIDDHGKMRMAYFSVTALTEALAANGTIGLVWLPPGRKRILPSMSRIAHSAFGASRTLDVGHDAYLDRPAGQNTAVADPDAFVDGLDVSSAGANVTLGTSLKFDMYSMDETLVYATVLGGTMPIGATLEGFIAYLYE